LYIETVYSMLFIMLIPYSSFVYILECTEFRSCCWLLQQ